MWRVCAWYEPCFSLRLDGAERLGDEGLAYPGCVPDHFYVHLF